MPSASDEPAPAELTPAVPIRRSVTDDYIVCLEDGKKLKMLKRHLMTAYEMTPEQYRAKWGLKPDYPMVAPNYALKRQELAKKIGLGRKPRVVAQETRAEDGNQEAAGEEGGSLSVDDLRPDDHHRLPSHDRAAPPETSSRDADLYCHTEKGIGCADEAPGDGHGLADVPDDRDRDQVGATDTAVRGVECDPARSRHEDLGPGVGRAVADRAGIGA